MNIVKQLTNNLDGKKITKDQMPISRSLILLAIFLYGVYYLQKILNGEYLAWDVSTLHLGIVLVIITFLFVSISSTFVSSRAVTLYAKTGTALHLIFFILVAVNLFNQEVDWQNASIIMVVTLLIFTADVKKNAYILSSLISNALLITIFLFAPYSKDSLNFLIAYIVTSLSLVFIKLSRVKNNEFLGETNLFFEDILNSLHDAVLLITPQELKVIFANHASNEIFGTNISDLIKLVAQESQAVFSKALNSIIKYQGFWEGEINFQDKSGVKFSALVTLSSFIIEHEDLIFIKIANISKLKAAEEQLRTALNDVQGKNSELENSKRAIMNILEDVVSERSEAVTKQRKLTAVLESITEGVVVMDHDRKIYMYNDAALKMIDCDAQDIMNKKYFEALHFQTEKAQATNEDFIEKVYNGKLSGKVFNLVLLRNNGEELPVSVTTSAVLNDQDQIDRVVVVFRDDTEQRRIDRMRSEFVSVTSHQLRTPLTSIKWYVELISDSAKSGNLTEEQQKYLKQIEQSNNRMIELVNDLLNVSRIETGHNFELKLEQTNIIDLIKDVVDEQTVIANQRKVAVNINNNGIAELSLNIDIAKIRQVIMNLLSNAIKYSQENSTVDLDCSRDEQYFTLAVKDHGIGIPQADQQRVFEKFFRAANAVSKQTEGTGLGTYISRNIARMHGGDVTFISEEGKGTTFTLRLPLQFSAQAEPNTTIKE